MGPAEALDLDGDGLSNLFLLDPASGGWFKALTTSTGFTYLQGAWSAGREVTPVTLKTDALGDLFLFNRTSGRATVCGMERRVHRQGDVLADPTPAR